jgi:maleylacetoacetate isomerase
VTVRLFDFYRSSACYRVRIALNLKGVEYEAVPTNLAAGAQHDPDYIALNPQGFVPMVDIDGERLTQSIAIIDYLDATRPDPAFMPRSPVARAHVQAMALVIACDIHPVNNLRILRYLEGTLGVAESGRDEWYRHWIHMGFATLEAMASDTAFLSGDTPGLADICLIPQMFNARRFAADLSPYPKLVAIDAACCALPAFAAAHPDAVGVI